MSQGYIRQYFLNAAGGTSSVQFTPYSSSGPGGTAWGAITGTLSDQTDLNAQITSRSLISTLSSAAFTIATMYAVSTHQHSASDINSSTLALARMGGGTTNVSTFLNGTGNFSQPVYASISGLPTLGTAASTAFGDYASSTHNITSATHTFPGGTANFLRADGVFAAPAAGSSPISTVKVSTIRVTTTTSTFPIAELAFNVSNTMTHSFEFGVVYASNISTTGLRLGITAPSVSSLSAAVWIPQGVGVAGTLGETRGNISTTGDSVVSSTTPVAGTKYYAQVKGTIVPSANGTLQLTYATEVAGSAISTFAGSYGILTTL